MKWQHIMKYQHVEGEWRGCTSAKVWLGFWPVTAFDRWRGPSELDCSKPIRSLSLSTLTAMANLGQLPQELIRIILDLASYRLPEHGRSEVHKPWLCSLSLVHSNWRAAAQSLLTDDLRFSGSNGSRTAASGRDRHSLFVASAPSGFLCKTLTSHGLLHDDALAVLAKARVGGVKKLELSFMPQIAPALLGHPSLSGERIWFTELT